MDWRVLAPTDTWLPYHVEIGKVFDLANGHMTVSCIHPFDVDFLLICRALPAQAALLAVDQLLPTDGACTKILGSGSSLGSASAAKDSDSRVRESALSIF